jgi:hypothetical protein
LVEAVRQFADVHTTRSLGEWAILVEPRSGRPLSPALRRSQASGWMRNRPKPPVFRDRSAKAICRTASTGLSGRRSRTRSRISTGLSRRACAELGPRVSARPGPQVVQATRDVTHKETPMNARSLAVAVLAVVVRVRLPSCRWTAGTSRRSWIRSQIAGSVWDRPREAS